MQRVTSRWNKESNRHHVGRKGKFRKQSQIQAYHSSCDLLLFSLFRFALLLGMEMLVKVVLRV